MAYLVCPTDTKKAAFIRGFWKGMAAPLVLFSTFDLTEQVRFEFTPLPDRKSAEAADWLRVGEDIRVAAKKVAGEGA